MLFGYAALASLYWPFLVAGLIVGLSLLSVIGRAVRRWAEPEWVARTGGRVDFAAAGLLFLLLLVVMLSIPFLPLLLGR